MRITLLLITLMIISACGFRPVYGTNKIQNTLSNIEISIIPDREGQIIRNHLIDYFYRDGYPTNALYRVDIEPVQETIIEIGIDRADEASRAQLRQMTVMRLINLETNEIILTRTVRATSSYNILAGQFTTFVTQNDARNQALKALSDNIITQIEIFFK